MERLYKNLDFNHKVEIFFMGWENIHSFKDYCDEDKSGLSKESQNIYEILFDKVILIANTKELEKWLLLYQKHPQISSANPENKASLNYDMYIRNKDMLITYNAYLQLIEVKKLNWIQRIIGYSYVPSWYYTADWNSSN